MTREFLQQIRPNEYFDEHDHSAEIQRICQYLNTVKPRKHCSVKPVFTTDFNTDLDLTHRCGRPYLKAFMDNRKFLFLQYMYLEHEQNSQWQVNRKTFITPLAIIKDTFRAFFGSSFLSDIIPPMSHRPTVAEETYSDTVPSISHRPTVAEESHSDIIPSISYRPTVAEESYPVNRTNSPTIPYNAEVNEMMILDTTLQSTLDSIQVGLDQVEGNQLLLEYPLDSNQPVSPVNTTNAAHQVQEYWWRKSPILLPKEIHAQQVIQLFGTYRPENGYTKPYLSYRPVTRRVHLYKTIQDALQGILSQEEVCWTWYLGQWKTVAAIDLCRAAQQGGNVVILGMKCIDYNPAIGESDQNLWNILVTLNEQEGAWPTWEDQL